MPILFEKSWWEPLTAADLGYTGGLCFSWADQMLAIMALEKKKTVYKFFLEGRAIGEVSNLRDELLKENAHVIEDTPFSYVPYVKDQRPISKETPSHYYNYYLVWDEALMHVKFNDGEADISFIGLDKEFSKRIYELTSKYIGSKISAGRAYVMISSKSGIKFKSIGLAGIPLEEDNYDPEIIEDYKHVVADLNLATPCGRLILLDGVPGTGKSFLIRSLLNDVPNAMFVIISPQSIPNLQDPSIMTAILNLREECDSGDKHFPMIFIVEDADSCLAPRQADNMQSVSSMLNFTDGILGAMIDLRIVCSTNAKTADLDSAIMRPGRLCKRIEINELTAEHAQRVYKRLTDKDIKLSKSDRFSLAEVYKMAKENGYTPKPTISKGGGAGFKLNKIPDIDIVDDDDYEDWD